MQRRRSYRDISMEQHRAIASVPRFRWNGDIVHPNDKQAVIKSMSRGGKYKEDFDLRPITDECGNKWYKVFIRY